MMRSAVTNRKSREKGEAARDTDLPLERRIRQHIRRLVEARRVYVAERRRYELASRLIDQVLEQLVAPRGRDARVGAVRGGPDRNPGTARPVGPGPQRKDRLVGLWASFKSERLALYRDLGVLPYDDWKSFYDDLAARPGAIN